MLFTRKLDQRVTVQTTGVMVPDGDGGYTSTFADTWARIPAKVEPATAHALERVVASSVQANTSHLVTLRYMPGLTTAMRVIWHARAGDRTLPVTDVVDDNQGIQVILACTERLS